MSPRAVKQAKPLRELSPQKCPSFASSSVSALPSPHTTPEHFLHLLAAPAPPASWSYWFHFLFHVPIDSFLFHVSIDPLLWILNLLLHSTIHSWTWIGSFHTCMGFGPKIPSIIFSPWTLSWLQSPMASNSCKILCVNIMKIGSDLTEALLKCKTRQSNINPW